ncbi:MAG: hypothetical protein MJ240_05660 [Kiritimatiellae bacterium]|nr:hypothetical protein [Kiritimatiellia bacterium]
MKLKKAEISESDGVDSMPSAGGVIDFNEAPIKSGPSGASKVAALVAFLASLAAAVAVGAVAAMMYMNWELIANA